MTRAHQPGSQPIDIPEVIPNPAVVPKPEPAPREPAPKEPAKIPEKVPAGIVLPESSLAAANQCPRAHRGRRPFHFAQRRFFRKSLIDEARVVPGCFGYKEMVGQPAKSE